MAILQNQFHLCFRSHWAHLPPIPFPSSKLFSQDWDWANFFQQDISLRSGIEHMATTRSAPCSYQVKVSFSSFWKKLWFFFFQPTAKELFTITALIMISIRANQSQSWCAPLKFHANSNLNEPHLGVFVASSVIALIKLTCIVTQWGEHVLICLSDVHGERKIPATSKWGSWLKPAKASRKLGKEPV